MLYASLYVSWTMCLLALLLTNILMQECMSTAFSHTKKRYPRYCSTNSEMKTRFIPPLPDDGKMQLLQVTVLMRHGSRTPHTTEDCWEGYSTQWDCADTMTTFMKPASEVREATTLGFVFEKKYDMGRNALNGSCLKGQLIEEGIQQQTLNGQILRSAYITTNNTNQRLFESTNYEQLPYATAVRFRADDEQRTLVSGQILLSNLFDQPDIKDVIMPVITADYSQDVLSPKGQLCPALEELSKTAYSSKEYHQILNNNANKDLMRVFSNETLRWKNPDGDLIDCLMTTYCTDQHDMMPDALFTGGTASKENGVTDNDGSLFSQLFSFFVWKKSFHLTYNDAKYSKISMGPLLADITELLRLSRICTDLKDVSDMNLTRLHLISGHDSTLMPIMASWNVWDGQWTPYASMLIIESYSVLEKSDLSNATHAFRLLYNGQVITHKFPGCPDSSQLCDLDMFFDVVEPFAARDRDCSTKFKDEDTVAMPLLVSLKWAILFTMGACLLGSAASYFAIDRIHNRKLVYVMVDGRTNVEQSAPTTL